MVFEELKNWTVWLFSWSVSLMMQCMMDRGLLDSEIKTFLDLEFAPALCRVQVVEDDAENDDEAVYLKRGNN